MEATTNTIADAAARWAVQNPHLTIGQVADGVFQDVVGAYNRTDEAHRLVMGSCYIAAIRAVRAAA
jgi:hypothetical protein